MNPPLCPNLGDYIILSCTNCATLSSLNSYFINHSGLLFAYWRFDFAFKVRSELYTSLKDAMFLCSSSSSFNLFIYLSFCCPSLFKNILVLMTLFLHCSLIFCFIYFSLTICLKENSSYTSSDFSSSISSNSKL